MVPVATSMTQEALLAHWSSCNPALWHIRCPSAFSLPWAPPTYPTLHPILSYPILSYPILSYPILSCPTLSYPVLAHIIALLSQPARTNAGDHRHL